MSADGDWLAATPYAQLLQLTMQRREEGIVLTMPPHDGVLGRPGHLHGGAIAGLLEMAAWMTLRDALMPQGGDGGDAASVGIKPVAVTLDYLRGGRMVDTFATAEIVRLGRRIAHVEVIGWQGDRHAPIAHAGIKFLLRRNEV